MKPPNPDWNALNAKVARMLALELAEIAPMLPAAPIFEALKKLCLVGWWLVPPRDEKHLSDLDDDVN